jgi:galactitol-specific phosphotransferase system IIB component
MNSEAQQYQEQISGIKSSFLSALDDFKQYYVNYNMHPESEDYNTNYMTSKEQLQTLSSDVFKITNDIQRKIEDKDKAMKIVEVKLIKEKDLNQKLADILKNLNGVKAGSGIMIDDSKTDYIFNYYKNIEIFIGILIILALLVSVKLSVALIGIFIIYKLSVFQQLMKIMEKFF